MSFNAFSNPADLDPNKRFVVDWGMDWRGAPLTNDIFVNNRGYLYAVGGHPIIVNKGGGSVRRLTCSDVGFKINLREGEPILVADALNAPITITFAQPVTAVGAYLSAHTGACKAKSL